MYIPHLKLVTPLVNGVSALFSPISILTSLLKGQVNGPKSKSPTSFNVERLLNTMETWANVLFTEDCDHLPIIGAFSIVTLLDKIHQASTQSVDQIGNRNQFPQ